MSQPTKILAIGNSFSENAAAYLADIAAAGGRPLIFGRLYIGGCSLERHWLNVETGAEEYVYKHTGREPQNASITFGIQAEDWDYVTLQQVSHCSGLPETYHPFLENLSAYVKKLVPRARQVIHQTWAYAQNSEHSGFANYHNDQEEMYHCLCEAYNDARKAIGTDLLLPVGDAWQLARKTSLGDNLCADGFHGNEKGCYLGGAVWYEVLLGGDIRENSFCPEGVTPSELAILQESAHEAVAQRKSR